MHFFDVYGCMFRCWCGVYPNLNLNCKTNEVNFCWINFCFRITPQAGWNPCSTRDFRFAHAWADAVWIIQMSCTQYTTMCAAVFVIVIIDYVLMNSEDRCFRTNQTVYSLACICSHSRNFSIFNHWITSTTNTLNFHMYMMVCIQIYLWFKWVSNCFSRLPITSMVSLKNKNNILKCSESCALSSSNERWSARWLRSVNRQPGFGSAYSYSRYTWNIFIILYVSSNIDCMNIHSYRELCDTDSVELCNILVCTDICNTLINCFKHNSL